MRYPLKAFPALLTLLLPAIVWGLGADHPPGPIGGTGAWPQELKALVNTDNRVHGFFVNGEDILFFRGNTAKLNEFLTKYSKLQNVKHQVVLHPGELDVRSPWDKVPRDIQGDWRVYAGSRLGKKEPFAVRVEIWLGGQVKLEELRVPANITVSSGGEIEAFVEKHKQAQKSEQSK